MTRRNTEMKMTKKIEEIMFAPCGMNCMVCYKHCFTKKSRKPCLGCLVNDEIGKPEHCRKCKIKDCVHEKRVSYCYECNQFPCQLIKNLEKSYIKHYNTSLIANSLFVKEYGLIEFMRNQHKIYTCLNCGGIFSLHDRICTECGNPFIKNSNHQTN